VQSSVIPAVSPEVIAMFVMAGGFLVGEAAAVNGAVFDSDTNEPPQPVSARPPSGTSASAIHLPIRPMWQRAPEWRLNTADRVEDRR
jgi:hypothetical protein